MVTIELAKDEIKFRCIPTAEKYYNADSNFGVFTFHTKDKIPEYWETPYSPFDGDVADVRMSTLAGKMQQLYVGSEYEVIATLEFNKKYESWQYNPVVITSVMPKTVDQQKRFLLSIMTEKQVEALVSKYPNIVDDIINGTDDVDTKKLKGIGDKTYKKLKERVLENYIISDLLVMLQPFGIGFNMVQRLLKSEKNPALVKEKIIKNPYVLLELKGFGFKTVDGLALKINPSMELSSKRVYAFIKYHLESIGNNDGHTWIFLDQLEDAIRDNIPECIEIFNKLIALEKENEVMLHFNGDIVGLKSYYKIEEELFKRLLELGNEKPLKVEQKHIDRGLEETEKFLGFKLNDEQMGVVHQALTNNVNVISGKAGCVDCDTEFFTGKGWKKISEYEEGDMVLQYNADGTAEMVYPLNYIKQHTTYLNYVKNYSGTIDQCLSDEHTFIYYDRNGYLTQDSFKNIKQRHEESKSGFWGKIPVSFNYGANGIDLSDDEIRVMVAVIADGHFPKNTNRCRIKVKKERKIRRIQLLLRNAKIDYKISYDTYGYTNIWFNAPMRQRHFESNWYKCSNDQFKIIVDEIFNWDGHKDRYFTSIKSNADYIQFVFSACGYKSQIYKDEKIGDVQYINNKEYVRKTDLYTVQLEKTKTISMRAKKVSLKPQITKYKTIDNYEYCFTVPSHMLVLRRNDKIFITGNCGKTTVSTAILNIYEQAGYSIACAALSAKAAQRITEATGFPASTIHRLLEYTPEGFKINENRKLCHQVLLVDECSMINSSLFLQVVKSVAKGAKLVMCGDNRQLPPIGAGNIFSDLLNGSRDEIALSSLTKVLRQAEKSGILKDANMIRDGKYPISQPELKITTGELNDMTYMFRDDREQLHRMAINTFMKAKEIDGLDEVVIVTPRRDNCMNSATEFNLHITQLLFDEWDKHVSIGKRHYFVGSKVMQIVNDAERGVFNGEIGYVTAITEDGVGKDKITTVTVEFKMNNETKTIDYDKSEMDQLDLAYAMTCHKLQGSGIKSVIIVLDMTHYTLLDTCMLYTAITRAKKRCLLLSEPNAFKMCMKNNKGKSRKTWLSGMK